MVVERGPVPKKVTAYSTASKDIGSPAGVYHLFEIHIAIYQSRLSKCCRTHMYVPSNNGVAALPLVHFSDFGQPFSRPKCRLCSQSYDERWPDRPTIG